MCVSVCVCTCALIDGVYENVGMQLYVCVSVHVLMLVCMRERESETARDVVRGSNMTLQIQGKFSTTEPYPKTLG